MEKFCSNCGKELVEGQDVCLGCGKMLANAGEHKKKDITHSGYKTATGIIMIILGFCLLSAGGSSYYESAVLVYSLPGLLGLIAGILNLNTKKNPNLLVPAAILMFAGAVVNFLGIYDISLYSIVSIVFGIFNIKFSKE